jgi:hypothetical protein
MDDAGIEQLKVSRLAMDVVGSKTDFSRDPKFTEPVAHKVYYGPVYLCAGTVYMTVSVAGIRRGNGVSVAEVNLGLEDFVRGAIGKHGIAYILDAHWAS